MYLWSPYLEIIDGYWCVKFIKVSDNYGTAAYGGISDMIWSQKISFTSVKLILVLFACFGEHFLRGMYSSYHFW